MPSQVSAFAILRLEWRLGLGAPFVPFRPLQSPRYCPESAVLINGSCCGICNLIYPCLI